MAFAKPARVFPKSMLIVPDAIDEFDPQKFYSDYLYIVPASNELGQSTNIEVRITPDHDRLLSELIQSGKSPYRRKAELVRWCIHNGLQHVTKVLADPQLIKSYTLLQAHTEQLSAEHRRVEIVRYTKKLDETIEAYLSIGAYDEARRIVSEKATSVRACGQDWITEHMLSALAKFDYLFADKNSVLTTAVEDDDDDTEETDY